MKRLLLAASLLFIASVALAGLPKLPGPLALPQTGDSPGKVTFNHESHVDASRPDCTTCHPKLFRILKRTTRPPITHDAMKQGQQCGACHSKTSFGFEDDCTMCHR
jgi:c(7)-type cytochrome triheme protein